MLTRRMPLAVLAALTFSTSAHTEQALNKIYHVLNYSCYKTEVNAEIVEYCTPVHTDSVEKFNVPMGDILHRKDKPKLPEIMLRKRMMP